MCLLLLPACARAQKSEDGPISAPPSPSSATHRASLTPPSAGRTKDPARARGAYEGRWQGTYEALLERVVLEVGGVRAWQDDDGKLSAGKGTLTVEVHPDGTAEGEAQGPLGAQRLRGIADAQGLRLTLSPEAPDVRGFSGTLLAAKSADGIIGQLRASSGDSLTVRKARVELRPGGS